MAATAGVFNYVPALDAKPALDAQQRVRLAEAAALEPILRRWRHRCSDGLIDASGKIRHVFKRAQPGARDTVGRVIEELNEVPEAVAELNAAYEARKRLDALQRHAVEMPVADARGLQDTSLDGCGFRLVRHTSRVTDWTDSGTVAATYYDEINALVKEVTGATHTFSNNHLLRRSQPDAGGEGPLAQLMAGSRGAVLTAHNDFTESYGEGIVKTLASGGVPHTQTFGMTEPMLKAGVSAQQVRDSRILVVNTWRSVTVEPLQSYPLALLDRRTVQRDQLCANLIGKVPSGEPRGGIEVYSVRHDPGHAWYYYPGMSCDEVLLWKGFDSAEVPMRPTMHSSFRDPNTPPNAPPRLSVEVRVLCLLPAE